MKKKLLIGISVFVLLVIGAFTFLNYQNRTKSPPGIAEYNSEQLNIKVKYSRPSVRDRLIFGTKEEGALQPYGEYWRFGANESTQISFSSKVLIMNTPLDKGEYRIYAIPQKEYFDVTISSQEESWGYSEPDHSYDIGTFRIPIDKAQESIEQFTIAFVENTPLIIMKCVFGDTQLEIPIEIIKN